MEPPYQSVNPLSYKVEFAVGTANYQVVDTTASPAPTLLTLTGLNTVATYRQPNGDSGTLLNSPSIFGPSGFVVPSASGSAGVDAGTADITSTPQGDQPGSTTTPNTTFEQDGGVFSYGFQPFNSSNNSEAGVSTFTPYDQPFYTDAFSAQMTDVGVTYLGGPPAYTNVETGTYPSGFLGYTEGFNSFAAEIAKGTYTLRVVIPTSPSKSGTLTAQAVLKTTTTLPTYTAPTSVSEDGKGGATFTIAVPAGVTETLVDVVDLGLPLGSTATSCHTGYTAPFYYTVVDHTAGPAVATIVLPDAVGPVPGAGGSPEPTLCSGDQYAVEEVGVDYPAYEDGPGQSVSANGIAEVPSLLGSAGQTDITVSAPNTTASGQYGVAAAARVAQKLRLYVPTRKETAASRNGHLTR